jgi:chromate transporter
MATDEVPAPDARQLFFAFLTIGLSAFGGALPWARRELVVRRRWLGEDEFAEILALCQFIPGPNVANVAVVVGRRFGGLRGAVAATLGLFGVPFLLILITGSLYSHFENNERLHQALSAMACVAAGLMIAMAYQLSRSSARRGWVSILFLGLAFVATGPLGWPLPWVLLGLFPLAVVLPYFLRKRE